LKKSESRGKIGKSREITEKSPSSSQPAHGLALHRQRPWQHLSKSENAGEDVCRRRRAVFELQLGHGDGGVDEGLSAVNMRGIIPDG
jgi:hypothetical protein